MQPSSLPPQALRPSSAPNSSHWLTAWFDLIANIKSHSSCIRLADVFCDGEFRLIVGDLEKRLRIYRGTGLETEVSLLDVPSSICIFFAEDPGKGLVPYIAVASGAFVFVYKNNLRPLTKFTLPQISVSQSEMQVWDGFRSGSIPSISLMCEQLAEIRDAASASLSVSSLEILSLQTEESRAKYFDDNYSIFRHPFSSIVCMETIKIRNDDNDRSESNLIIATESGSIFILSLVKGEFQVSSSLNLPPSSSCPYSLFVNGFYDLDFRIIIWTRDTSSSTPLIVLKSSDSKRHAMQVVSSRDVYLPSDFILAVTLTDRSIVMAHATNEEYSWVSGFQIRGSYGKMFDFIVYDQVTDLAPLEISKACIDDVTSLTCVIECDAVWVPRGSVSIKGNRVISREAEVIADFTQIMSLYDQIWVIWKGNE